MQLTGCCERGLAPSEQLEGGQLKAKQDGVVRPGASWLSLAGLQIGQLLTSRPRSHQGGD